MLLNVAAHNVSKRNIKVSKRECHIMYSITKRTVSQNVKCTLHKRYKKLCNGTCFVTLYECTLCDIYVLKTLCLELLRCVQLLFVTLHHVAFMLCCFTLCSNILQRVGNTGKDNEIFVFQAKRKL